MSSRMHWVTYSGEILLQELICDHQDILLLMMSRDALLKVSAAITFMANSRISMLSMGI